MDTSKARLPMSMTCALTIVALLAGSAIGQEGGAPNLIFILNPAKAETLKITTGGVLSAPNGKLHVFSRDRRSVVIAGDNSQVEVKTSALSGGADISMGGKTIVKEQLPPVAARDPLGEVPVPAAELLQPRGKVRFSEKQAAASLLPGLYESIECGLGATIELKPGVYAVKELYVHTGAMVSGSNVMLYVGKLVVDSQSKLILSAPNDGPYKDLVLFISRRATERSHVSTSAVVTLSGALYCPVTPFSVDSSAKLTCTHLVVNTLEVSTEGQLTLK